jgi:hypothetical protein
MANIRGQKWTEFEGWIQLKLRDPFWSAYAKYGWEKDLGRVEGMGISKEAINYANERGKKIRVIDKYGKFEISPSKCRQAIDNYNSRFVARDGSVLVVVPRTYFNKIIK